jgi:hypothetical protein
MSLRSRDDCEGNERLDFHINTMISLCRFVVPNEGKLMIPPFDSSGALPPGIHDGDWREVVDRFGYNTQRQWLLQGLRRALLVLHAAGCTTVYLDGSFVTSKDAPRDYDLCWSAAGVDPVRLDPVLLTFADGRRAMKAKYLGDLFPADGAELRSGKPFVDFFQIDKDTGAAKGIVLIDLRGLP